MGQVEPRPTSSPDEAGSCAAGADPASRTTPATSVSVIIVSFHHGAVMNAAVRSLGELGDDLREILVVDNAGDLDGAAVAVSGTTTQTVIRPGTNLGFAAAVNLAAAEACADLLLLLSPDAQILRWDGPRLDQELSPEVGAIGAFTRDRRGRPTVSWGEFPGVCRMVRQGAGLARRRDRAILQHLGRGTSCTVPWLLGAALVIRRGTFVAVGGLDATYFSSGDDQDLGARLRRAGLRCVVSPAWRVRHEPRDARSRLAEIRANDRRFIATHGGAVDRLAWRLLRRPP